MLDSSSGPCFYLKSHISAVILILSLLGDDLDLEAAESVNIPMGAPNRKMIEVNRPHSLFISTKHWIIIKLIVHSNTENCTLQNIIPLSVTILSR